MPVATAAHRRHVQPWRRTAYRLQHASLGLALMGAMGLWHRLVGDSPIRPSREAVRLSERRYRELLAADLANAERGVYPRELLFGLPLATYLRSVPFGLVDMGRVLLRSRRGAWKDLPKSVDLSMFPKYYARNFHWQTDGWLSARSARLYDPGVEMLFMGTADVMRRMALPPIVTATAGIPRPRVVDLGCGTGRLLLQIARTVPRARLYGVDLSPWYLAHARALLGGRPGVSLLAEDAGATSLEGSAFDAVTCVFLFHELPRGARREVMREALRLLRPGAPFVALDSAQLSDSPGLRAYLEEFPRLYHEPFYREYLRDDLERAMTDVGLEVVEVCPWFVSKLVVGRRPA